MKKEKIKNSSAEFPFGVSAGLLANIFGSKFPDYLYQDERGKVFYENSKLSRGRTHIFTPLEENATMHFMVFNPDAAKPNILNQISWGDYLESKKSTPIFVDYKQIETVKSKMPVAHCLYIPFIIDAEGFNELVVKHYVGLICNASRAYNLKETLYTVERCSILTNKEYKAKLNITISSGALLTGF